LNVEQAARTSGFDVIMSNITETQKQLTEALQNVKDWMVDGIVLILPAQGLPPDEMQSICDDIPLVQLDCGLSRKLPSVSLNDAHGAVQLMEHLFELGHRQFAEISGSLDWYSAQIRHQTVAKFCKKHGLEAPIHI